jgi:hypothetical protein
MRAPWSGGAAKGPLLVCRPLLLLLLLLLLRLLLLFPLTP